MGESRVVEKIKPHLPCSITFFSENLAINVTMWENMGETDRPQMTIQRMCFARWISKVTDTYSEYVILIFLPQQWLHKSASMLRYTYIETLVHRYYNQL